MDRANGEEYRPRRDASTVEDLPPPAPVDRQRIAAARDEAVEHARLMERVALGDAAAFGRLYEHTCARVHGLMLRVLKDEGPAAEVTRETFVEAWQRARSWDEDQGTVFSWLVTIAHRRAVDRVRSEGGAVVPHEGAGAHALTSGIDGVWGVIEQALGSHRVRVGLRALTWIERQAILLAYFESFTPDQVAELLDREVHPVTTSMREGLRNLRRALGVGDDE